MTNDFAIDILKQYREKPTLINEIETQEEATWLDEALDMAIKALEQTRWIPVTEYEPEEYGEFMITWVADEVNKPLIGFAEYEITGKYDHEKNRFKGEWLFEDYVKAYTNPKVTAWMPLPNPYNGGES